MVSLGDYPPIFEFQKDWNAMSNRPIVLNPACIKTLSAVEARPERSNQHEFNGVAALKDVLGTNRSELNVHFSVRGENIGAQANVTWYDAREDHPTRSEHRLYFQKNEVMDQAQEGDNVIIGYDGQRTLHCILIRTGSSEHRPGIGQWETY